MFFLVTLPPATAPFSVEATENVSNEFPGAPRIQSFSFAQWKGRWVFIGGRTAGYHGVGGATAEFLRASANRDIWVVDTNVKPARTYHAPVDSLPASLALVKDQWTATAQLYHQDGAKLYISGGYGQNHAGEWVTYPILSAVDLPQLIDGVMQGNVPAPSIAFAQTPLAQSSGGELIKLDDGFFYLVMGHDFEGSYTAFEGQGEHSGKAASQTYLNEIRKLQVSAGHAGELSVRLVEKFSDPVAFHRRDLNAAPVLSPSGLGLGIYGGVFTPDTQLGYTEPIYLASNGKPAVDSSFEQKMNAYTCPKLLIYDKAGETMYTTLFGGISRYAWRGDSQKFVENSKIGTKTQPVYLDGLQWSDQISTIRKVMTPGREETTELVHATALPGFLGTDGVFIPVSGLGRAHPATEILDMQQLRGRKTFVGYIYGGIQASPYRFPYLKSSEPYNAGTVPTEPSGMILKVYVQAP